MALFTTPIEETLGSANEPLPSVAQCTIHPGVGPELTRCSKIQAILGLSFGHFAGLNARTKVRAVSV